MILMSDVMTEKSKICIALIMCAAVSGASLICGTALQRRDASVPAVEIVEMTSAAEESAAEITVSSVESETEEAHLMVNINTADADELDKLAGVGKATADAIIEYRENTPFQSIEDIMNVKGIGEKKFEAIKDNICV